MLILALASHNRRMAEAVGVVGSLVLIAGTMLVQKHMGIGGMM